MGRMVVDARVAEALEDALGEDQSSQGSAKNVNKGLVKCGWRPSVREDRHPAGL
jgi:hypothetical protein